MEQNAQFFETARETILKQAAEHYGRSFADWGEFYAWLLDIDRDRLLYWENQRIDLWNRLVLQAPTIDDQPAQPLNVESLKRNAENAFALFGVDANPSRDSVYEMPRGGERQLRVARQMQDPNSPLNRGYEDWESFDLTS